MTATTLVPTVSPTSCELFQRCLEHRDDGDWRCFLERFRRMLPGLAAAKLEPWVRQAAALDVEDLLQEVHCRLLGTARRFRGRTDRELWAYLRRVVVSLTTDHRRRWQASKRSTDPRTWQGDTEGAGQILPAPGPEERLLAAESWEHFLDRCARCFSHPRRPLVRRVVHLVWVEGTNSHETAERLGGVLGARDVDNLIGRLRRRLARQGLDLPRRVSGSRR